MASEFIFVQYIYIKMFYYICTKIKFYFQIKQNGNIQFLINDILGITFCSDTG